MSKILLSLSGGLDSAVLCARILAQEGKNAVQAIFFRYGSKHGPWEEKAAVSLAAHFQIQLTCIDLQTIFSHTSSALLQADARTIPQMAYDAESMGLTVVPGRNLIFVSILASIAESRSIPKVALAIHGGDHALYADCRPGFAHALATVVTESSGGAVSVEAPFINMSKADIVANGLHFNAPLALTRSCYAASELSCGVCGTCIERLAAFKACGLTDPIPYQDLNK